MLGVLKEAAMKPGSVSPAQLVKALAEIEKAKAPLPDNWYVHR